MYTGRFGLKMVHLTVNQSHGQIIGMGLLTHTLERGAHTKIKNILMFTPTH